MPRTNCLEGWKCPECGNKDKFTISVTATADVTDEGIEDGFDYEWDNDSFARCSKCGRSGSVLEFKKRERDTR